MLFKERLFIKTNCLYIEKYWFEAEQIYSYENCWYDEINRYHVVHRNSYKIVYEENIYFVNIYDYERSLFRYYEYKELDTYKFHSPIPKVLFDLLKEKYKVVEIKMLNPCERSIEDLISLQFVNKVIEIF